MSAHHLDRAGDCVEDCPHPAHDSAPVVVAMPPAFKPMFDDWVEGLGLAPVEHQPLPPDEPTRAYLLRVPSDSPWMRPQRRRF